MGIDIQGCIEHRIAHGAPYIFHSEINLDRSDVFRYMGGDKAPALFPYRGLSDDITPEARRIVSCIDYWANGPVETNWGLSWLTLPELEQVKEAHGYDNLCDIIETMRGLVEPRLVFSFNN